MKYEKQENGQQALALPATADPFKTYADAVAPTTIIGTLLKFSKGEFFAGKDSRPVAVGTHFIANLDATMAGWVKWINGRPIDHRLVRIADGLLPVKREQLGDTDTEQWQYDSRGERRDPWQQVNYLPLVDQTGEIFTLSVTQVAGIKEVAALCSAYADHRKNNAEEFPVIELGVDSYMHRERHIGRVKYPTLNVVGWEPKEKFAQAMVTAGLVEKEPTTLSILTAGEEPPPHTELPVERNEDEEIPF